MDMVEYETPAGDALHWRLWPAGRKPLLSLAVALFALLLSLGAMASFGSGWYAFITLVVLTLALAPHYFPASYRLDGRTVRVSGAGRLVERPWSAFRAVVVLPDRVILSPLSDATSWLARRRSVTLMLADNGPEVLDFIARRGVGRSPQTASPGAEPRDVNA